MVYRESRVAAGEKPMGTTLTALVIREHEAFLAHVGDSRAFLIRGREIRQLTEDHSLVAELVRDGVLSATEAEHHPSAHIILRALGLAEDVTFEVQGPLALRSGDTLVLCTDGLTRQVRPDEIRRLAESQPPRRACEGLVALANERGGPDNITRAADPVRAAEVLARGAVVPSRLVARFLRSRFGCRLPLNHGLGGA